MKASFIVALLPLVFATICGVASAQPSASKKPGTSIVTQASKRPQAEAPVAHGSKLAATIKAHEGPVTRAVFGNNGKVLLSAGEDRTLKLWNVRTAKLVRELWKAQSEITAIALSEDGRRTLAGDEQGNTRIWDSATGKLLDGVIATAIARGARVGAAGTEDGAIELWHIQKPPALAFQAGWLWSKSLSAMVRDEKYDELDKLVADLIADKTRLKTGERQLVHFFAWFENRNLAFKAETHVDHLALEKWLRDRPKSAVAKTIDGAITIDQGFRKRGGGLANTVTAEAAEAFFEHLAEAEEHLEEAIRLAPDSPAPYPYLIRVGQGLGWDKKRVYALVEKSRQLDPEYFPTYVRMAEYLLPRWHGDPGELAQWAGKLADDIGGDTGDAMYYYIATRVVKYEGPEVFAEDGLDYERVIAGGEALLKKYPLNYQIPECTVPSNLAYFACLYGDRERARNYILDVAGTTVGAVWTPDLHEHFEQWAGIK